MTPNNADNDIPYIVLAAISPPFCHMRHRHWILKRAILISRCPS